jgi:hypothetical protein
MRYFGRIEKRREGGVRLSGLMGTGPKRRACQGCRRHREPARSVLDELVSGRAAGMFEGAAREPLRVPCANSELCPERLPGGIAWLQQ